MTPWTAFLSFIISWSLLKLMSTESVMPSNHLIFCHPLLLPSIFPSIRVFSSESALHIKWPKFWNFSFSISHSNEYSGLIFFFFFFNLFYFLTLQYCIGFKCSNFKDVSRDKKKSLTHNPENFSSVQFSCSVVSDSLQPHEPQHAKPPCPSPTPGVYSNPCPLS